jgi:hypothetical protein
VAHEHRVAPLQQRREDVALLGSVVGPGVRGEEVAGPACGIPRGRRDAVTAEGLEQRMQFLERPQHLPVLGVEGVDGRQRGAGEGIGPAGLLGGLGHAFLLGFGLPMVDQPAAAALAVDQSSSRRPASGVALRGAACA